MAECLKCFNDFAAQMSMAENEGGEGGSEEKMEVDDKDQDYSEVSRTLILGFGGLVYLIC